MADRALALTSSESSNVSGQPSGGTDLLSQIRLHLSSDQPQYQRTGSDTSRTSDATPLFQNGVFNWRYGDNTMDRQMWNYNPSTISIDTPAGVTVKNWADNNGYFFWFENTANGQSTDGIKHYYPPGTHDICINGQTYDVEAQKLKVSEDMANSAAGGQYFQNLTQTFAQSPMNVVRYAAGMSQISGSVLATEESVLEKAVQNSSNPYFKIYLADVYTAQAMQPIIAEAAQGGHVDIANPETTQRINMAINLLNSVVGQSRNGLAELNQNVPGNTALPLDPYQIYMNPSYQPYYYGFWAGSYDQASYRAAALTMLQNLINTGSLASQLSQVNLLPPAQ